ncbi:MAG: RluA family pseudouridine synthase [Clostridia bacterium]|nr:RluA family pseudouridine synthase [Clostridia bacterium]MBQ8859653.1 RluA family pseudouridine synthase [Clostridia bacterium]
MRWIIPPEADGQTVKDFLRDLTVSARTLRYLKDKENGITQNGKAVTVRAVLRAGDELSLSFEDTPCPPSLPSDLPSDLVLYEDEHILVLNKPAGMPTHPSMGHRGDTLSDLVLAMDGAPVVFRAVNRLDRGTSGVLLVARNRYAAGHLSREMAEGRIRKEYLAVVERPISPTAGTMQDGIAREEGSIIRRVACPAGVGDYAETDYETVYTAQGGLTLVRLFPKTGRTHQLRVQLASRGYPIVGDDLYGGAPILARQALHAAALSFCHPNGHEVTAKCDLPKDMSRIFDKESL